MDIEITKNYNGLFLYQYLVTIGQELKFSENERE